MGPAVVQVSVDVANLFACGDVGEPADHVSGDGTTTRVRASWSPVDLSDLGAGFVADVSRVTVPRSAVRTIERGDVIRRTPDDVGALLLPDGWALLFEEGDEFGLEASAAEPWDVEHAQQTPTTWQLVCLRAPRPVPRGR